MKHFVLVIVAIFSLQADELSLEKALELASQRNPQLREASKLVKAAKARVRSVGTLPNPQAIARVEGAPRESEYLIGFEQSIPLGGRLSAARELERSRMTAAELEAERMLLQVQRKVHGAFATALFADEAARIQSNMVHSAEAMVRILQARVEAGDALREDLSRVESEALQARVELKSAEHLQEHARKVLFSEIGDPGLKDPILSGAIGDVLGVDHLGLLVKEMKALENLGEAAVNEQKARLNLARKERIPDVSVELLYRRIQPSREDGFDAGIRVEIPIFGQTRQKIRAATAELGASEARLANARLKAEVQEHEIRAHLENALAIANLIKNEIQPRAARSLAAADARYKAGDLPLTEFLARRREYLAVQENYLRSLRSIAEIWTLSPH